jgi:putative SOS response-associated peptidase YedK
MPAILRGQDAIDAWLNTRDVDVREAVGLAVSPPAGTMKYYPVSKAVGRADAEGPKLILPLTPEQAAEEAASSRPKKKAAGGGQMDLFG